MKKGENKRVGIFVSFSKFEYSRLHVYTRSVQPETVQTGLGLAQRHLCKHPTDDINSMLDIYCIHTTT